MPGAVLRTTRWPARSCLTALLLGAVTLTAEAEPPTGAKVKATAETAAAREGGPRRWIVTSPEGSAMRAGLEASSEKIMTLAKGTIVSNLGCTSSDGVAWCAVQPLRARVSGYVPAASLVTAPGPDGSVPYGLDDSAARARVRDFDATGVIRCAQERGQPLGDCRFGVARGTGGDATVRVAFPNGFSRMLFFAHNIFLRAAPTMSGVGVDTDWVLEGDVHRLRVEDQRYEIPQATILGG
ncbi:MAG: hypothetical protein AAF577_00305 [Pseudomonadota bacterium]